jgi:peptidoglycan/xylan/chitin deacetylase (PgdA/CDA1 family)
MQQLALAIEAKGFETRTYRSILADLQRGVCPASETVIVSIDDLGTNWLRPDFKQMIDVFLEHEMVLVAGAVSQGTQNQVIWGYLQEIERRGIEIASHTSHHYQLSALTYEVMLEEVNGSYAILCENLENCPVSIILPFGAEDERLFTAPHKYIFLVGIQGGLEFGGEPPFYVGRIPPSNDDQNITIFNLESTFNP